METGYVFLDLTPGTKKEFIAKIKDVKAVKEARLVIGFCDAVAVIEAENTEELEKTYFNEIDKMANVKKSRLHIVACSRASK